PGGGGGSGLGGRGSGLCSRPSGNNRLPADSSALATRSNSAPTRALIYSATQYDSLCLSYRQPAKTELAWICRECADTRANGSPRKDFIVTCPISKQLQFCDFAFAISRSTAACTAFSLLKPKTVAWICPARKKKVQPAWSRSLTKSDRRLVTIVQPLE